MRPGRVQFIPAVVHCPEKVVRKPLEYQQPARQRLFEHHLRHLPCLLQVAGLKGVETHSIKEAQSISVRFPEQRLVLVDQPALGGGVMAAGSHAHSPSRGERRRAP